jgi:sulfonate transport system permease protein
MSKSFIKHVQWKDKLLALIVPLLLLILWQSAGPLQLVSELILTPPLTLFYTLADLVGSGELTDNIIVSLQRVVVGFLVGASSGFILGIVMGLSPFLKRILLPLVKSVQQVPEYAWMPLLIILFSIGELPKIIFIAIGAFYPMVFNTFQGISGVPKNYHELANVYNYKNYRYLTKVIIPGALPSIFTGIRLSLGLSWMFVVGAELFGCDSGIGYMMIWGRQMFQIDLVMSGLVVIGAIGFVLNCILEIIEKRLFSWRRSFEGGIA